MREWVSAGRWKRGLDNVLLGATLAWALQGCCLDYDPPSIYLFLVRSGPIWGGETVEFSSGRDLEYFSVQFIGPEPPVPERFVEFFDVPFVLDVDGATQVEVPVDYDPRSNDGASVHGGGCPDPYLIFDLRELPRGVYMAVHRRSMAPPDTTSTFVWDTFEGEDAIMTWFVLDDP